MKSGKSKTPGGSARDAFPPLRAGKYRTFHSREEAYLKCGEAYRRTYVDRERKSTTAMARGSAVGHAADLAIKGQIEGSSLNRDAIVDLAVFSFEERITDEPPIDLDNIPTEKDGVANAAGVWNDAVFEREIIQPYGSEVPIVATLEHQGVELELGGILDLVDGDGFGDLKCGRKWSKDLVANSRQLTRYGILYYALRHEWPKRIWIDSLYTDARRRRYGHQRLYTQRTHKQYVAALEVAIKVKEGLDKGFYPPAPEGSWYCSKQHCGFYSTCRYTGG